MHIFIVTVVGYSAKYPFRMVQKEVFFIKQYIHVIRLDLKMTTFGFYFLSFFLKYI